MARTTTKTAKPAETKPAEPLRAELVPMEAREAQQRETPTASGGDLTSAIAMAIERNMSAEAINALLAAAERADRLEETRRARAAESAFVQAMTAFKADAPKIVKRARVGYTTNDGDFVGYSHAKLADVVDAAVQGMTPHGLSHRWVIEQQDKSEVRVTCILQHRDGHSVQVTMTAPPDDSGKKNKIQQIASTVTYLERYTLMALTGLAAEEMDDDAGDAGKAAETDEERKAREQREADAAAAKVIEDGWYDKLGMCQSLEELRKVRLDISTFYGGDDAVSKQAPALARRYNELKKKFAAPTKP